VAVGVILAVAVVLAVAVAVAGRQWRCRRVAVGVRGACAILFYFFAFVTRCHCQLSLFQ
jgi:hypothetical protein